MEAFILALMIFLYPACLFVGANSSDNGTLKSCVSKGEAKLMNGVTIKCEVKKETNQE